MGREQVSTAARAIRSIPTNLSLMRAFRRSPLDFIDALVAAGADEQPIMIGSERVLLLADPAQAWELLTTHAKRTGKGRGMTKARLLLGDGLLTSEGDDHRQHRRLLQPAFHSSVLDGYLTHFTTAARRAAMQWTDGGEIDLVAALAGITLDGAGSAMFGADLREPAPAISAALSDLLTGFRLAMAPGGVALLRSPLPAAVRVREARARLQTVVDELVGGRWSTGAPAPVLEHLAARPETEQRVRDEVMTLLLAGHETTAMALTWALIAVHQQPKVRRALEAEWERRDDPVVAGDLPARYPWTTAAVAETLRLYPPSWMFTRRVREQIMLDGRVLEAGLLCMISPALLHRDRRWWVEPREFQPERWLRDGRFDPKSPGQPRGAYLPFGAGPRMCIGEQFAWIETTAVLAELGRHWRLLIDTAPDPGPASMTLRPGTPVRAITVAR